jgi:hypothetical protein
LLSPVRAHGSRFDPQEAIVHADPDSK